MERYIGTKLIEATPAIRKGGKIYEAGIPIPRSMEPEEYGYKVCYPDGYVSWSPKDVFEEAYRPANGMNFGLAIEAAKKGKRRPARDGTAKGCGSCTALAIPRDPLQQEHCGGRRHPRRHAVQGPSVPPDEVR